MIIELVVVREGEDVWVHAARDAITIDECGGSWGDEIAKISAQYGAENVRIVKVKVPRDFMVRAFEPLHVQGKVRRIERVVERT